MNTSLFKNRKLIIATKHKKEQVIAPLLEKQLGVICFVDKNFDTDTLGTFSGEIERESDPITTVRKKCLAAMKANHCDLGVASEGSFGAHPSIYFAKADDEFVIFIDQKNGLEIIAREISTETNFDGKEIKTEQDLLEFAKSAKFPSHGLILKSSKSDPSQIVKGINNITLLQKTFSKLLDYTHSIYIETDMRAMYNPSRMKVIANAAQKLVDKINSSCPECQSPGFDITETKKGLQCSLCGLPTKSILSHILKCQNCSFTKEVMYPHKITNEDPMYCNYCNP